VPRARFARVSSALHWRFLPRPGSPIKPKNAAPVAAASDGRTFVLADGRTVQLAVIEVHLTRFYLDASAQGGGEQRFSAGRRLSHQIGHGCPATGQAMGDDIGWMQPSIYYRGLMVGETRNIDRIGNEGAMFKDYRAQESCTAGAMPSSPACIRCAPE
jgi:hypothetical protein